MPAGGPASPASELDLLANALARLDEALAAMNAAPQNTVLRDGAIKRFEFTYEMAVRCLRSWLRRGAHPDAGRYGYRTAIRFGADAGLLADPEAWISHTNSRRNTSHSYNEPTAVSVSAGIPQFAGDARRLLERLRTATGTDL